MHNYTPKSMKSQVQLNIQKNIPLAPLTTFKIGGPAKFFVEVSDEEALLEALQFANENNLKVFVLGGGSNILVSDEGFDGLVIKLKASDIPVEAIRELPLRCWAGENLASVVSLAKDNSLAGLEWATGIPGTIGGAVFGNAGAFGKWMEDVV
jgi:UDP-N-acetylmuramate dehydrogenase